MAVNINDYAYEQDGELVLDASDAQQYAIAVAKEMSKYLFETEEKVYKVPVQKKLYSRNTIPNELLLDKKGRLLVGSAKESRIEKILREQEKYLNDE